MSTDDLTSDAPPSTPSERHRTGNLLGAKYRLERRLGAGGMGEVWLATNVALDLPVALKLLHADAGDPKVASTRSHLLREARAAAAMSHPAIVRVFDFGRTFRGDSYIVMERLHGEDLRDRLMRGGPLRPEDAVRLVLPIASGLHAAHLRGVVHRDLKPENVFLTRDDAGRLLPKIVDFGLADLRWIDDAERVMAGTPDYMSPEQIEGTDDPDHHVDTWALCCVLHELLVGKAPFDSPDLADTFKRIVAGEASRLPEHVDERLRAILVRGLATKREDRFRSSRELGEALARWLMARGISEDITGQSLSSSWFDALGSSTTYDQLPALSGTRVVVMPSQAEHAADPDSARCDTLAHPQSQSGESLRSMAVRLPEPSRSAPPAEASKAARQPGEAPMGETPIGETPMSETPMSETPMSEARNAEDVPAEAPPAEDRADAARAEVAPPESCEQATGETLQAVPSQVHGDGSLIPRLAVGSTVLFMLAAAVLGALAVEVRGGWATDAAAATAPAHDAPTAPARDEPAHDPLATPARRVGSVPASSLPIR